MSDHHAPYGVGIEQRHLRTVAIILAALLVASLFGIWHTSANVRPLGSVGASVSPSVKRVGVGDTFTVQVLVSAGANEVYSADAHLTFDPTYIQLAGVPTAGDLSSMFIQQYSNTAGTIDIGAAIFGTPATGSIVLCSLSFEAMAETAGTSISLNQDWGSNALLVVGSVGAQHTATWTDGTVIVSALATETPTATATDTPVPPTATNTPIPPTATDTPIPPTVTDTPIPPTVTDTPIPPTATDTPEALPTATRTGTPETGTLCIVVFYDMNGDGVRQSGEPYLSGALVTVYDGSGHLMAEFISDALHQPRCVTLPSGQVYTVVVTPPVGFSETEPHTTTATVSGGRAASVDFGETSPLGVPTIEGERLLLPLIMRQRVMSQSAFPETILDRIGVAVYRSDEPGEAHLGEYPLDRVQFGWYVDWWFQVDPTKPDDITYARILPVDALYPTDPGDVIWGLIRDQAELDPGAIWFIGNEPECVHQGNRTPEEYAAIYKAYYDYLKEIDPYCVVGIGGIVQPTPLRLEWLDLCLASYETQFGEPMPIEVWNIHNMVLNEKRGDIGAEIPVGLPDDEGIMPGWWNSDDLTRFTQQLIDFRAWMADNGYRNMPLLVTEFGVLYPEVWFDALVGPSGEERIKTYMTSTFDHMLNATDPEIGCPLDGDRLVQRWAYLSLNSPTWEEDPENHFSGQLCLKSDQTLTAYGLHWETLIATYLGL